MLTMWLKKKYDFSGQTKNTDHLKVGSLCGLNLKQKKLKLF